MTEIIKVNLANNPYKIFIGSNIIKNYLLNFIKNSSYNQIFIISNNAISHLHYCVISNIIQETKLPNHLILIPDGEEAKSFENFANKMEEIIALKPNRKSLIIAFGGGVVGDFSGFIASVLLRGVDFIQIPTTLLAAVDSSVGGKTAINSKFGKNLVGSFYQPKMVICDLQFLQTLPIRQIKAGYAEVLKYGLIFDEEFFIFLEQNFHQIYQLNHNILTKIIAKSCQIKAEIVSQDEKEQNIRAILNFGHSFAHIFEANSNYSNILLHGEAVALGMAMASKMSLDFNLYF